MALSDTCSESFNTLVNGFVDYHSSYNDQDLNKVMKAMFELAELITKHDAPPRAPVRFKKGMAKNLVVNSLLSKVKDKNRRTLVRAFYRIAQLNPKFLDALEHVKKDYRNDDPSSLTKYYANIYKTFTELDDMANANLAVEK